MNAGEATHDDGGGTKEAWAHCGMLTAGTFTVVFIADDDPVLTGGFQLTRHSWNGQAALTIQRIARGTRIATESVDRANEHVVGNVVQVAAEAQPFACRRNVVGGGLAARLQQ